MLNNTYTKVVLCSTRLFTLYCTLDNMQRIDYKSFMALHLKLLSHGLYKA